LVKLKLFIQAKAFQWKEQIHTFCHFYPRFALVDLCLGVFSFFYNPYRVCRKFRAGVYGETPLRGFKALMEAAGVGKRDQYVELGSGRGRTCFWAALFVGCQVRGVEWVPLFVGVSKFLNTLFCLSIQFEQKSMFDADLAKATVVYIYYLSDLEKLPLHQLPSGAKIITISEPISGFSVVKTLPIVFPWGKTTAYIHIK